MVGHGRLSKSKGLDGYGASSTDVRKLRTVRCARKVCLHVFSAKILVRKQEPDKEFGQDIPVLHSSPVWVWDFGLSCVLEHMEML